MTKRVPRHVQSSMDELLTKFRMDELSDVLDIAQYLAEVARESYRGAFKKRRENILEYIDYKGDGQEWVTTPWGTYHQGFVYSSPSIVGEPHTLSVQRFIAMVRRTPPPEFDALGFVMLTALEIEDEIKNRLKIIPLKGIFKNAAVDTFGEALGYVHESARGKGKEDAGAQILGLLKERNRKGWDIQQESYTIGENHQLAMAVLEECLEKILQDWPGINNLLR